VNEQRNFLLAFIIIFVTLFGYEYFFPKQPITNLTPTQKTETPISAPIPQPAQELALERSEALSSTGRVLINTPNFKGSIRLLGARLDDLTLKNYKETIDSDKQVDLLDPEHTQKPFYLEFLWSAQQADLPNDKTLWETNDKELTPDHPIILRWKNKDGIVFERHISVDKDLLFTVRETLHNTGNTSLLASFSGAITKAGEQKESDSKLSHEGFVGYLDGKLKESSYKDMPTTAERNKSSGGWIAMTDKYWMLTLAVQDGQPVESILQKVEIGKGLYKTFLTTETIECLAGQSIALNPVFVFAGPKIVDVLDNYEAAYSIKNLDLLVDFGWLYFLTKPLYHILNWLKDLIGNFAIAILALTVLVKMLMFPLLRKSSSAMAGMKKLQPEMDRLKNLYPDDPMKRNQEIMALYKKHKINPAGGCLPMLIQMPVFFALYKVLVITIEMRHAPFWGWIQDMSVQDPTSLFNLFGLIPWAPPSFLMIGLWPIIMGATMWAQQKLSPQTAMADPNMGKMMNYLPLFLTYVMSSFPAGLVIYWAWSNILTILQQVLITNRKKA
jgi:YidC/Oxa1 family membrane protein insertase